MSLAKEGVGRVVNIIFLDYVDTFLPYKVVYYKNVHIV